jgi:hypothetical protein
VQYKVEWIETELLPDPDDYAACSTLLYKLSGIIDPGQAEEFERFFRAALARITAG